MVLLELRHLQPAQAKRDEAFKHASVKYFLTTNRATPHRQLFSLSNNFFMSTTLLLYRLFCRVCVVSGVVRLRRCRLISLLLRQLLRGRRSEDARGCFTIAYDFWFGNKSHHYLHLLHYLLQGCVLWKRKQRKDVWRNIRTMCHLTEYFGYLNLFRRVWGLHVLSVVYHWPYCVLFIGQIVRAKTRMWEHDLRAS